MLNMVNREKEKTAISECKSIVASAQAVAAKSFFDGISGTDDFYFNNSDEILKTTSIDGEISTIRVDPENCLVTRVEYISTERFVVVYDSDKTPKYQVKYELSFSANGIMAKTTSILNDLKTTDDWDSKSLDEKTQTLQKELRDFYYDENPLLDDYERTLLTERQFDGDIDEMDWRPIIATNGDALLAASSNNDTKPNPLASLIYYNGSYYYWGGWDPNKVTTHYVSDKSFDINLLKTAPVVPTEDSWIRIED